MKADLIEEDVPLGGGLISAIDDQEEAQFEQWQANRNALESRRQDLHFQQIYTDPKKFAELADSPEIKLASKVSPDPEVLKRGAANRAYLSFKAGHDVRGLEYEATRDGYAKQFFG